MKEILGTGAIIIGALLTCMFGIWLSYVISMAWFGLLVIAAVIFVVVGTFLHIKERIHEHRYGTPAEQAEARYQKASDRYFRDLKRCNEEFDRTGKFPDDMPRCPDRSEFK